MAYIFGGDSLEHEKIVGRRLRALSNLVRRYIDNSDVKKQIDDMTGTNGRIIGYIARNSERPIYQRDLEREFGITRSTASKVVILMEKKGFIRHECAEHDARLKRLILTERSEAIVSMMEEDASRTEEKLTAGFSEEELCTLREYLDRMINNMEE